MSSIFRFKQFSICHDHCLMKVGTDGVLLGALADPSGSASILDIGTGSGLIAMMMAQKCGARITGIDIDGPSILQAAENATNSPWTSRIEMIHSAAQEYAADHPAAFDMVISNPPFFSKSLKSPLVGKNRAKHDVELTFQELLGATSALLKVDGNAWFIIPKSCADEFLQIASICGFHLAWQTTVFPKKGKPAHRLILQLVKYEVCSVFFGELAIRNNDDAMTDDYKAVCYAFYLD